MPSWTKIFSKKNGQSIVRDKKQNDEDESIPKFMHGTRKANTEEAKPGRAIRFLYDQREVSGTCHWMEGIIDQRVTKETQSKRTGFTENWFNIRNLQILTTFGDSDSPIPDRVRVNLAPKFDCFLLKIAQMITY